jgi:hypothetical protein
VPSELLAGSVALPPIAARVFYDKRIAEAEDEVPRYSGYLASQWAVTRRLLPALLL